MWTVTIVLCGKNEYQVQYTTCVTVVDSIKGMMWRKDVSFYLTCSSSDSVTIGKKTCGLEHFAMQLLPLENIYTRIYYKHAKTLCTYLIEE